MKGVKHGGRKKGVPNKTTAVLKEALLASFERVGGVEYLVKLSESHPDVYCKMLMKLLPQAIEKRLGDLGTSP